MNLFVSVVDPSRQHQNFKNLLRVRNGFVFDVLQDWAKGFVDRDGKFVEEFQTTFNSCFWELYIFAVLKKYGMNVDFSNPRPDFCIPSLNLNIEAIIASHAEGSEPEFARMDKEPPGDLNEFNRNTIIRLSGSLREKHRKYTASYASLSHVKDRAYVVAVSNFDQPYSFMAASRPIDAVLHGYYVDEEKFIASKERGERLEGEALDKVLKNNGSPIELGMFSSPAYKEISAVIFSNCANMGKVRAMSSDPGSGIAFTALRQNMNSSQPHVIQEPKRRYQEHLLDGLRVYHNPFAVHPLDRSLFRHPVVFQSYWENDWVYEQREGQLLCRWVNVAMSRSELND